ncbi:PEP-CTERM sorting domain-containing protein [Aquabacterium sp. J223]|uniref:PEP-CTERM sorting domain-containing protein n=1 Tax=Aquabacterium sp. J223 TaxID=2898431 RepID=UPI0021AE2E20|nr:PEP-CTERM sorting domain-containing protein [Aquabacterium sp. J223]UUX94072.1 PEP-CTERM sorting domain-containing protein [Aquabacterium sp. J223]
MSIVKARSASLSAMSASSLKVALGGVFACVVSLAHGVPIPMQGTWTTTLLPRDLNADGTADAYYDTTLNITWLANAMGTLGTVYDDALPGNGESTWTAAKTWAASLDLYGVTGWRLPRFLGSGPGPSEVSHMHCVTLGNRTPGSCNSGPPPWNFVNSGPFQNLNNNWVWLDEEDPSSGPPPHAWAFAGDAVSAYHTSEVITADFSAWAVRDGDVPLPAIPEPGTWALMALGIAGLAAARFKGRT